jgi:hypothetical protein
MKNESKITLLVSIAMGCVLASAAFTQQKPCETASKFGAADQIGNLNYITREKTLTASRLITAGKTYRLGIETN